MLSFSASRIWLTKFSWVVYIISFDVVLASQPEHAKVINVKVETLFKRPIEKNGIVTQNNYLNEFRSDDEFRLDIRSLMQDSADQYLPEVQKASTVTLPEENKNNTHLENDGDTEVTAQVKQSVKIVTKEMDEGTKKGIMIILSGVIGAVAACAVVGMCIYRRKKKSPAHSKYPSFHDIYHMDSGNTKSTLKSLPASPLATMIGLDDEIGLADDASSANFTYSSHNYFQQQPHSSANKSETSGFTDHIMATHDLELMINKSIDLSAIEVVVDTNEYDKNNNRGGSISNSRSHNRNNSRDSNATSSTISELEYPLDNNESSSSAASQINPLQRSSPSMTAMLELPIEDTQRRVWNAIRIDSKRQKRISTEGGVLDSFDEKADSSSILTDESDAIADLRRIDSDIWSRKHASPTPLKPFKEA